MPTSMYFAVTPLLLASDPPPVAAPVAPPPVAPAPVAVPGAVRLVAPLVKLETPVPPLLLPEVTTPDPPVDAAPAVVVEPSGAANSPSFAVRSESTPETVVPHAVTRAATTAAAIPRRRARLVLMLPAPLAGTA